MTEPRIEAISAVLERAIAAADTLQLDTTEARAVATTIADRAGYPSDLYVLALAGGTGVGKSSLLNAIAGEVVSAPGVRRPTTSSPIVWLPAAHVDEGRPLIDWLGGAEFRTTPGVGPAVAILDLPDLDSIVPDHAARVDAVLPRIDAVLWVTDPEKYDDSVLHDGYLRRWMPRLAHQAMVINKADRLDPDDVRRVAADLQARLATEGLPAVPMLLASAVGDVGPVLAWLERGAAAKEIVRGRLRASAASAVRSLAASAGVAAPEPPIPLVAPEALADAVDRTSRAILDIVDLRGLRAETMAATRGSARSVGGGPIGLARSLLERGSGVGEAHADPEGYLRRWRQRGTLDRAVAPIRELQVGMLGAVPPPARPSLSKLTDGSGLADGLADGVDRVVSGPLASHELPSSPLWPVLGLAQTIALGATVVGVVWLAALFTTSGAIPTSAVELPIVGQMPTPVALIVVGLLCWFVLGRMLSGHASLLGRRWADALGQAILSEVSEQVGITVGAAVAGPDDARRALWAAFDEFERVAFDRS